ncbi:CPBP family glutamic-type intramembrane protease [Natrarchaeobius sp. A-rgal3]|uniref:CPBP family intramembrane glutamic endopeptidase n=1 Tax=Natrarchaeobius versutus TaxID=1679078 RepID=UPI00350FD197
MPQWVTFVGITGVVLVLLLVLSYLTQSAFTDGDADHAGLETDTDSSPSVDYDDPPNDAALESGDSNASTAGDDLAHDGDDAVSDVSSDDTAVHDSPFAGDDATSTDPTGRSPSGDRYEPRARTPAADGVDPASLSTGALLANVALSQGLFALVLLGAVLYTGIPAGALGVEFSWSYVEQGVLLGTVAGIVLYVANELGASFATRFGFDHDEQLRELLAPESTQGWLVLLVVVLPIIAVFEELLFRAALIGVVSAGFGVSPWLLAVLSSVAFAVGHGVQGSVGIIVTGLLGFVLATVFIVTGSFLVVVVAHYLINALEFVVHERFELEWASALER